MSIDRRFISNLRFTVKSVIQNPSHLANLEVGNLHITTEAYAQLSMPAGAIIEVIQKEANKSVKLFYTPTGGECVFNEATEAFLRFDTANGWVSVVDVSPNNDGCASVEVHTLNASEVTAKSFTLSNSIASGEESNTICIVEGVAQVYNTDFTASGTTIGWNGKGLADIGLMAGDTFVVLYRKANS